MQVGTLDITVFVVYFLGTIIFAMYMSRRKHGQSASGYFLANRGLPWYAIGASIIAAGVSTEHFIGTVGWAYLYGMAVANWQWAGVFVYSVLIWIFLPFYLRGGVTTMPEFLERRYNKTCRYMYAMVLIVGMVIATLGGVMFAGSKAMNILFPQLSIQAGIVISALAAGSYTIYGGLLSGVWADLLQYCLLMIGGAIVTLFGLHYIGGLGTLLDELPEKAIMVYGADHEMIPWTGLIAAFLSVGVWYNCANQFIIQRCLGGRSEWDARMGVVMAGFTTLVLPFVIVIPGLIGFYMMHDQLNDADQTWPLLAKDFLPAGLTGLVLSGLASAIMSTLSAIINASATIFTFDLYQPLLKPQAEDRELWIVGRISGAVCLVIGVGVALLLAAIPGVTIFEIIQTVFFYVASPITAIFFVGIMWRRATAVAAVWTLVLGFASIPLIRFYVFPKTFLAPYDTFSHHTFAVLVLSICVLVIISLFTRPKPSSELVGVIWDTSALRLPESERHLNRGVRNFVLWWAAMVLAILSAYVITNSRAVGTTWLEAEKVVFHATGAGAARIQERAELERFTLWTGRRQVRFDPQSQDDALVFEVPIERGASYIVAAVVTRGPEFGSFRAAVNDQPAHITVTRTVVSRTGPRYRVQKSTDRLYHARLEPTHLDPDAQRHVVERIVLGTFALQEGINRISLQSTMEDDAAAIGVDQLILTRVDD